MSHAKPVDERGGHHALPAVLDAGAVTLVAPALPDRLATLPGNLRELWIGMWTSPVAAVLDPVSDLEPMTRLFELYGLDAVMGKALNNYMNWLASPNPYAEDEPKDFDPQFARVRLAVSSEVRQLEQTLGITPRGRLVIGAAVAAAGRGQPRAEVSHDDAED